MRLSVVLRNRISANEARADNQNRDLIETAYRRGHASRRRVTPVNPGCFTFKDYKISRAAYRFNVFL
jgi:hypothetical protein